MGFTTVKAKFYNPWEYTEYVQGKRPLAQVRQAEVEALVDTGAIFPGLPQDVVEGLGLTILGEMELEAFEGMTRAKRTFAFIEVEGRWAVCSVLVKPAGTLALVGVTALEQMGYRVDPASGRLIPGLLLL